MFGGKPLDIALGLFPRHVNRAPWSSTFEVTAHSTERYLLGRGKEGRFKSLAILDDEALLTVCAYVVSVRNNHSCRVW